MQAYAHSLQTVFLVAVPIGVVAFLLTFLLPEITLRKTTGAVDPGQSVPMPTDHTSLEEMELSLTRFARRDRRELLRRLAARAQLQLDPASTWLLLRIDRHPDYTADRLVAGTPLDSHRGQAALQRLADAGLATVPAGNGAGAVPSDGPPVLTAAGREAVERIAAAHREKLTELLEGWSPEEHDELTALVHRLTAELLDDQPAPPTGGGQLEPDLAV